MTNKNFTELLQSQLTMLQVFFVDNRIEENSETGELLYSPFFTQLTNSNFVSLA